RGRGAAPGDPDRALAGSGTGGATAVRRGGRPHAVRRGSRGSRWGVRTTSPAIEMKPIVKLKDQARLHEQREEWEEAIRLYLEVLRAGDERDGEAELGIYNRIG